MDPKQFREAFGCFATGIAAVGALGPDGKPIGITANAFASVSLEPPLVLLGLNQESYSLRAFLATETFAVNILRADQSAASRRFAQGREDKWSGVGYDIWVTGCPIPHDAPAEFERKIRDTFAGGDHVIFLGAVPRFAYDPKGRPLVFYRSRYQSMSPHE